MRHTAIVITLLAISVPPHAIRAESGDASIFLRRVDVPLYPPLARQARVQGTVVLEVTTSDGSFGAIKPVSGHVLLSNAAKANLQTWRFDSVPAATFTVTFEYTISKKCKGDPAVTMNLPARVAVCTQPPRQEIDY